MELVARSVPVEVTSADEDIVMESVMLSVSEELAGSCVKLLLCVTENVSLRVTVSVPRRLFVRVGGMRTDMVRADVCEDERSREAENVNVSTSVMESGVGVFVFDDDGSEVSLGVGEIVFDLSLVSDAD